jgi:hypothetical protein
VQNPLEHRREGHAGQGADCTPEKKQSHYT